MIQAKDSIHRSPPFSVEFEQALLAGCIIDGGQDSIILCIQEKITPASFYLSAHQLIYQALLELFNANTSVNELIVSEKLSSRGELEKVGGYTYINAIANRIDTPAHLKHYIKRVKDFDLVRRIITVANTSIENAYGGVDDVGVFLDEVEQSIFAISEHRISDAAISLKDSISNAEHMIDRIFQRRGEVDGVASGFTDLDRLTFGLRPGEMIVVAARPSMGKTSFALNIAEHVVSPKSSDPIPTLFFSLEMSAEQLALRMMCGRANVHVGRLRTGFLPKEDLARLSTITTELKKAPLWIDQSCGMSITEMRAKARRMYNRHKLGLIIIDYLQLLASHDYRAPREQQISEISRGIKAMVRELSVPVLVLSQLNRDSEKEKRQPRLSDLRESGSIEQDADVVLLLSKNRDNDEEQEVLLDIVRRDLIIAKQRNGPTGVVPLAFKKSLTRFENYAHEKKI
ncbi:MAG: replicative DNA helicase [Puniceicoccales bacterium]|nr:replicative DNA helicase [Puniceicoccales bacterium]